MLKGKVKFWWARPNLAKSHGPFLHWESLSIAFLEGLGLDFIEDILEGITIATSGS